MYLQCILRFTVEKFEFYLHIYIFIAAFTEDGYNK